MFNLFNLFRRKPELKTFVITARRYQLPASRQAVFGTFRVEAVDSYAAAREFDNVYTKWTRLDVVQR